MASDLQSIGTFGWFPDEAVSSPLEAVSTFGWFSGALVAPVIPADILYVNVKVNTVMEIGLER